MDERQGGAPRRNDNGGLIVGAVLVAVGLWLFLRQLPWFDPIRVAFSRLRGYGWPLVLVLAGVALIVLASRGERPHVPARGTRLYRARHDKWVSGVLGGLGHYFGIDPTVLRIGFLAAALVFGIPQAVVAYLIATWVVPEEPVGPAPGPVPHGPSGA